MGRTLIPSEPGEEPHDNSTWGGGHQKSDASEAAGNAGGEGPDSRDMVQVPLVQARRQPEVFASAAPLPQFLSEGSPGFLPTSEGAGQPQRWTQTGAACGSRTTPQGATDHMAGSHVGPERTPDTAVAATCDSMECG